ncbi:MAG: hypothetical protein LBF66_01740 [Holosporales bacterium]|jgi:hypothetical protein|nr:hypothetical protein [Holosporales bacterium]
MATELSELSGLYSDELLVCVIDYGRVFHDVVINKQEYHLFDPMISDRSCQLRAIWLAEYCRKSRGDANLPDEDAAIFGLARFLVETSNFLDNDVTGRVPVGSNIKIWPKEICEIDAAGKRRRFWGVAKSIVQRRVLKDLHCVFSDISSEYIQTHGLFGASPGQVKSELLCLLEHAPVFSFSEIKIPMFHFFPSLILVASLASAHKFPVVVIVREIKLSKSGTLFCAQKRVFCFVYDDSSGVFMQVAREQISEDQPSIVFLAHSYAKDVAMCATSTPERFLDELNALFGVSARLFDYIYAIAATHSMLVESSGESSDLNASLALTALSHQYSEFAYKTDLVARKMVAENQKFILGQLGQDSLEATPFRITHVFGGGARCLDLY